MSAKFETSESMYNRLKNDHVFNKTRSVITYFDSVKNKYVDMALCSWKSIKDGGDIPWHRVYFIKYDGDIIWNRELKICLVDELHARLIQEAENALLIEDTLRIMTWNILSDTYEKRITNMKKRKDAILQYIQHQLEHNVGIICLQEVNDNFYFDLYEQFKSLYNIVRTDLLDNNVVLMSKLPLTFFEILKISREKSMIYATIGAQKLNIFCVHLTSDQHGNAEMQRSFQLSQMLSNYRADDESDTIILGDCNTSSDLPLPKVFCEAFTPITIAQSNNNNNSSSNSVNSSSHDTTNAKSSEGNTHQVVSFNSETNKLAKTLCSTKRVANLDRLFYTSPGLCCVNRVVDVSIQLSDHYPVIVDLKFNRNSDNDANNVNSSNNNSNNMHSNVSSHSSCSSNISGVGVEKLSLSYCKSALAVIIPYKYWNAVDNHNNSNKWMPHINVLFPFLDTVTAQQAITIKTVFKKYAENNSISIGSYDYFTHENSHDNASYTIYGKLSTASATILTQLQHELCIALGIEISVCDKFTPHLTIQKVTTVEQVHKFLKHNKIDVQFPLKRITHISNLNNNYYEVVANYGYEYRNLITEFLTQFKNLNVFVGGSAVFIDSTELSLPYCVENNIHDIDLLVTSYAYNREQFMEKFLRIFKQCGYFCNVIVVTNQHTQYIKIIVTNIGISYDVHYCQCGLSTYNIVDINSRAVYDASNYVKQLNIPHYYERLLLVKRFLKSTHIYGLQYGYLSGISTAVMVAFFMQHSGPNYGGSDNSGCGSGGVSMDNTQAADGSNRSPDQQSALPSDSDFIVQFCRYYSVFDFTQQISVNRHCFNTTAACSDFMRVALPCEPFDNTVRTMTQSSFNTILSVLKHYSSSDGGSCSGSFSPIAAVSNSGRSGFVATTLTFYCHDTTSTDLCLHMFHSIYTRMILKFEKHSVYPSGDNAITVDKVTNKIVYVFYYSRSLIEVNTVWVWLEERAAKIFGDKVYVEVK